MLDNQPSKVLCVDRDPGDLTNLRTLLDHDFECHIADSNQRALEMVKEHGPYEVIIAGIDGDSQDETEFLKELKTLSPATVRIMLATESTVSKAQEAVSQGYAFRFVVKPCSEDELVAAINSAVLENTRTIHKQQLHDEAMELTESTGSFGFTPIFDPELGIGSIDAFVVELQYSHNVATRYKRTYSLAVFDIDMIHLYAQHYGKKAAKLAHKLLAEHIRHSCRAADRVFRLNEDTAIALILPETPHDGCLTYASRAVNSFFARNIPNSQSEHKLLTISTGIAGYSPDSDTDQGWQQILDEAMVYLHVAQGQGGNCVSHAKAW